MSKTIIIAEAGVNHNGDLSIAKQLISEAAKAGADIVKFQTFKAEKIVTPTAAKASYQKMNEPGSGNTQFDMLKRLEMPIEWHYELRSFAEQNNITFLSTGFDEESIDLLDKLGIPFFKVPSGEITNLPYLQYIASKGKPVMISTGMANMQEVKDAVNVLVGRGISIDNITVLHCNTEYPTPMTDVNLHAMLSIQKELNVSVGYSDHTLGIEVPIAAVALGASVIEKHFTLDSSMPGPDHKASLEPHQLSEMVRCIRNIELAISGSGKKEPSGSEEKNRAIVRKSLHFAIDLKAGTIIERHHLIALRPGNGVSPMEINKIIGQNIPSDVIALTPVPKNIIR